MSYGKRVTKEIKGRQARTAANQARQVQRGQILGVPDSALREAQRQKQSAQQIADEIVKARKGSGVLEALRRTQEEPQLLDEPRRGRLSLVDVEVPDAIHGIPGNLSKNVAQVASALVASGYDVAEMEDVALGSGDSAGFRESALAMGGRAQLDLEKKILAKVDREWARNHDLLPREIAHAYATQLVAGAALMVAAQSKVITAERSMTGHAVRRALQVVLEHAKERLVTGLQPMRTPIVITVERTPARSIAAPEKEVEHPEPAVAEECLAAPKLRAVPDLINTSSTRVRAKKVSAAEMSKIRRNRVFGSIRELDTKLGPLSEEVPDLLKALRAEAQDPNSKTSALFREMAQMMTPAKYMGDGIGSQTKLAWGKLQGALERQANTLEANPDSQRVAAVVTRAVENLEVAGGFMNAPAVRALS